MGRTEKARGSRSIQIRDWPFGSRGRRLFLQAVLLDEPPPGGWRKADLERAAEVERGGADRLIEGAASLDLLSAAGGRWLPGAPPPRLAGPLERLVELSADLPDAPIRPLPRRPYRRSAGPGGR
jgi:hypothetical protein